MMLSTKDAISSFLFLDEPLASADVIFVFGNDWIPTMDHVARLYKSGVSRFVLITGHSANKDRKISEASRFMERGLELGIPRDAFILEHDATNTKENFLNCIPILDRTVGFKNISSILFVCKTFHTRRVLMTARRFFPTNIAYGFYPVEDERNIQKDNWWMDPVSQERVIAELRRVAEYTLKGDLSVE